MDIKRNNLKNFKNVDFEYWKTDAQKFIKDQDINQYLKVNIEDVELRSIYTKEDVTQIIKLSKGEVINDHISKISTDEYLKYNISSSLEIALLFHLIESKNDSKHTIQSFIPQNFFFAIAKFRALRYLLENHAIENNYEFNILAYSSSFNKSLLDEENNLIRATYECLSAITGTADSVKLFPYDKLSKSSDFGKRITDNIKRILIEESYISKVDDPLSGSFLIENLTGKLINRISFHYNKINDLGGIESKDCIDYIHNVDKKSYAERKNSIETGEYSLIGVNKFQNPEQNIVDIKNNDIRLATDFELYKKRIDENKPRIYLANFTNDKKKLRFITNTLNVFNIDFESSTEFELVEDAYNTAKLFRADILIINADENDLEDIVRVLKNMKLESEVISVNEFQSKSIIQNIKKITTILEDE